MALFRSGSARAGDPFWNQAVRRHLADILASPAFRGSERSKQFLQFVVERALDPSAQPLKERDLGIELFGRVPDYDTGTDAIVRVKANEVRKRLDQFYREQAEPAPILIELQTGSYLPKITQAGGADGESAIPPLGLVLKHYAKVHWRAVLCTLVLVLAAVPGVWWLLRWQRATGLDAFWAPVVSAAAEPIICLGRSDTYALSSGLRARLADIPEGKMGEPVPVKPNEITRFTNFHISFANFSAVHEISRLLQRKGRETELRWASELKLGDVHGRPLILVGAFSNPWTLRQSADWRFRFQTGTARQPGNSIVEEKTGRRWFVEGPSAPDRQTMDYGLVTRVIGPAAGEVVVTAAGINSYGTQVAGSFLTDPSYWRELTPNLPKGWERKNIQVLLRTNVVSMTASPPRVVAFEVW